MLLCKYVYSRKIRCDLYKKYGRNLYKLMRMLVDEDREVE